jgi:hypothetical protein
MMCRKPYNPPELPPSNHILSIDGFINTGENTTSSFQITHSVSLTDSLPYIPEQGAQVSIISSSGTHFPLAASGTNGMYTSAPLSLDSSLKYQVFVTTSEGNTYASDFVSPMPSPPIDSLSWETGFDPASASEDVNIYINSHDPNNNTRYYRWDFVETWEHVSNNESFWGEKNGLYRPIEPIESLHYCWSTDNSNQIILGTTDLLSQDVVSHILLSTLLKNDPKMDIGYSILARQYALDLNGYTYWLSVQKNSQSLGGLFDLQPSQVRGNIQGVNNPSNPVVGFVTASSVQERRLFISNKSLDGWKSNPGVNCPLVYYPQKDTTIFGVINYPDTSFVLWYFAAGTEVLTRRSCVDCRYQGGTTVKPSFWP